MRMCFARVIAKERSDCGNLHQQDKIAAVASLLRNDTRKTHPHLILSDYSGEVA